MSEEELNRNNSPESYDNLETIVSIGTIAVRNVQEKNTQEGVPNVYSCDGKIFYEVNGAVTTVNPFDVIKTTPDDKIKIGEERFIKLIDDKDITDAIGRHSLDVSLKLKEYENLDDVLFVVMMNSGAWYSCRLFNRLQSNPYKISYATTSCKNDKVKVSTKSKRKDINGKHIIVISGLSTEGKSISKLSKWLEGMGAASVDICLMMCKTQFNLKTINKPIIIDDNDFIVGCGIGYNDIGRNLNIIYKKY